MMTKLLNNRYQIIQVLGAGGFGETFLAEDTYMPSRRRCVIKQLKPMIDDPQMYQSIQQRFQREATTLEFLGEGSNQIPKLYAYFTENGQFYLVQEWIQGETLTSKVEANGPLSETAVRDILVSLLPVLDYVHRQGIIYRDIKPDNIILRDSNGKPVLIDFGAVKETVATGSNSRGNKNHTMAVGTPGFMSPEQASGRPTYASDIYGLGMTAIYLLTGKLPSELEIDSRTGQILWQEYTPNISPHLAAILDRAIQCHPRDRYTTAIKMLDELHSGASVPHPQPKTEATIVMSPPPEKSSKTALGILPQTAPAIAHSSTQSNWQKNLILGCLLTGGLVSAALVIGFVRNQPPQPSSVTITPLPSTPEQPTVEPTLATSPNPVDAATRTIVSAPPEVEQQTTQASSPSVDRALEQNNETQNAKADVAVSEGITGFPIGTSESRVKAALGNPTQTSRGIWGNTKALIYDIKPDRITLGYLFDRTSRQLRQTEVSFAQTVPPEVMQATLQQMLGDRSIDINQGLQQVYQRRTNKYSFQTRKLKVAIERNERDRIYIGVWDADLH